MRFTRSEYRPQQRDFHGSSTLSTSQRRRGQVPRADVRPVPAIDQTAGRRHFTSSCRFHPRPVLHQSCSRRPVTGQITEISPATSPIPGRTRIRLPAMTGNTRTNRRKPPIGRDRGLPQFAKPRIPRLRDRLRRSGSPSRPRSPLPIQQRFTACIDSKARNQHHITASARMLPTAGAKLPNAHLMPSRRTACSPIIVHPVRAPKQAQFRDWGSCNRSS